MNTRVVLHATLVFALLIAATPVMALEPGEFEAKVGAQNNPERINRYIFEHFLPRQWLAKPWLRRVITEADYLPALPPQAYITIEPGAVQHPNPVLPANLTHAIRIK